MYEIRDEAWKIYRKSLNNEPLENWEDLQNAFNAGWKARKDLEYKSMINPRREDTSCLD